MITKKLKVWFELAERFDHWFAVEMRYANAGIPYDFEVSPLRLQTNLENWLDKSCRKDLRVYYMDYLERWTEEGIEIYDKFFKFMDKFRK